MLSHKENEELLTSVPQQHRPRSAINSLYNKNFDIKFEGIKKAFEKITIYSPIGASAMDLLEGEFNSENVLVYLDSPYIGTAGYSVNKAADESPYKSGTIISPDDYGKNFISNDFDMKALLEKCKSFKGKFIFSCRVNMSSANCITVTVGKTYDDYGRPISKSIPYVAYNNYIWFLRQWMETDYYALFMMDKDEKRSDDYYEMMRYDETNKKRILEDKNGWGTDILDEDKEQIYEVLRYNAVMSQYLEVMITNFDFDVPVFGGMSEFMVNPYGKKNHSVLSDSNNENGL